MALSNQSRARRDEPEKALIGPQREARRGRKNVEQAPAPGRMFVVGRVLNPEGKPVPNATVMVAARAKALGSDHELEQHGQSHGGGTGNHRWLGVVSPRRTPSFPLQVMIMFGAVALAPGFGAAWVDLDPDAGQPKGDITLRPEQVIQGRLFDVQGRPAAGVEVRFMHGPRRPP